MSPRALFSVALCGLAIPVRAATPAPANDDFANRALLAGAQVSVVGTTSGSTQEADEADHGGGSTRATVWWTWMAPNTGTVTINAPANNSIGRVLAAYTGDSLATLRGVSVTEIINHGPLLFHAVQGRTYQLVVATDYSFPGDEFTLGLTMTSDAPVNDQFADATIIPEPVAPASTVTVSGSNVNSSSEYGEPRHRNDWARRSVWWRFTATSAGGVSLNLSGTQFVPRVSVYTGSVVEGLLAVPHVLVSNGELGFGATLGVTYYIAVDGYYGATGPITLTLTHSDRRQNDNFVDASGASGQTIAIGASLAATTAEAGEPAHGGAPAARSRWWSYMFGRTGTLTIDAAGDGYTPNLSVYTGDTLATLSPVLDGDPVGPNRYRFHYESLTRLYIAVDHPTQTGAFTLNISLGDGTLNDQFAGRIAMSGSTFTGGYYVGGATREHGEVLQPGGLGMTAWWKWTAPADGTVIVDTKMSSMNTILSVYTGTSVSALTPVALNDDARPGETWSQVAFRATAGVEYVLSIDQQSTPGTSVAINLRLLAPPANDDFASRIAIVGEPEDPLFSQPSGAMAEPGEPAHGTVQPALASVWWTWTAPRSGKVMIWDNYSPATTILAVYTGATLATLQLVRFDEPEHRDPRVVFDAIGGTAYSIAIDSRGYTYNPVSLRLRYIEPPSNDNFANRSPLSGSEVGLQATNLGASAEPGEPGHAQRPAEASLWWTWTAPSDGPVVVDTIGSYFDTVLGVYTGGTVGTLVPVGSNDDFEVGTTHSRVHFNGIAGTAYQIVVDGAYAEMSAISLRIQDGTPHLTVTGASGPLPAGAAASLAAAATGPGPLLYQWEHNGVAVPGATTSMLVLPSLQSFHRGSYAVRVTTAYGDTTTQSVTVDVAPAAPSSARVLNLSTRAVTRGGADALIPGFVISGTGTNRVLLRAVGPGLAAFNLGGTLPDPRFELKQRIAGDFQTIAASDNWEATSELLAASASVGAFPLAVASLDAALVVDLPAGEYTVVTSDTATRAGLAIVELYDAATTAGAAQMINLSNRGHVGIGAEIMIPGFVVAGDGPRTFLIRVVGPELARFAVPDVLTNPQLVIYRNETPPAPPTRLLENNDWGIGADAAQTAQVGLQVGAFTLASGSKDAAFVVTLEPGVYTIHAHGVNGTTGTALVEVYVVR